MRSIMGDLWKPIGIILSFRSASGISLALLVSPLVSSGLKMGRSGRSGVTYNMESKNLVLGPVEFTKQPIR